MKPFDKVYKFYDAFMNLFGLYKENEIASALNLNGDEVIVDIGGGTGHLAEYLCSQCKKVYVIDESKKMLSQIPINERIIPIVGNALNTNFEDSSVDMVILSDVLHHIEHQYKLMKEIHRILNTRGKVLILDFDKRYLKTKLLRLFEYLLFGKLYFKTSKEVKALLCDKFVITDFVDRQYYFMMVGEKND